jgi:hypothetical protein
VRRARYPFEQVPLNILEISGVSGSIATEKSLEGKVSDRRGVKLETRLFQIHFNGIVVFDANITREVAQQHQHQEQDPEQERQRQEGLTNVSPPGRRLPGALIEDEVLGLFGRGVSLSIINTSF